jgi:hypothetical protein
VTVTSPVFLQSFTVVLAGTSTGWTADDGSFHVAPDAPHVVRFRRPPGPARPFKAHVSALNTDQTWTVRA